MRAQSAVNSGSTPIMLLAWTALPLKGPAVLSGSNQESLFRQYRLFPSFDYYN